MNKNQLITLIKKYHPQHKEEKKIKKEILNYLINTDIFFGKENKNGHITASTWIVNQDKTKNLLTHHKKLNKWLQLGGHTDKGEDIIYAALREAKEESGLSHIKLLSNEIFDIDIHPIPARKQEKEHLHYDIRFLVEADDNEPLVVSNESKDLRWIDLENIDTLTNARNIKRMVEKTPR